MLISLKAKNFRKHTDLTLDLKAGLNVLRGPNEQGKTTVIEIILYALYGSAGLRDSLSDVVTWGKAEKELSAEVVLRIEGALYQFTRSKAGAECNYEGGKVVGQKEVSAFASNLLGADVKTSSALMMASQNGLRGALDDGPAAVSGLMSKLADFDMIDRILEAANSKLLLGAEQPMLVKLDQARADLAAAEAAVPSDVEDQIKQLAEREVTLESEVSMLETAESSSLHPAMMAAHGAVEAARASNSKRDAYVIQVNDLHARHLRETQLLAQAKKDEVENFVAVEDIEECRRLVAIEKDHANQYAKYLAFTKLPAYPQVFWEGHVGGLAVEIENTRTKLDSMKARAAELNAESAALTRSKMKAGEKCPTCGHLADSAEHIAHVQAHNAGVDEKLAAVREALQILSPKVTEVTIDLNELTKLQTSASARDEKIRREFGDLVDADTNFVPARFTWKGEPPAATATTTQATRLAALEAKQRTNAMAAGRVQGHSEALATIEAKVQETEALLKGMPEVDVAPLQRAYDEAYAAYSSNAAVLREKRAVLDTVRLQLSTLRCNLAEAEGRVKACRARIAEIDEDLKKLTFNNTLVKKLKGLKPLITDHLWNTVLAAVSTFFSQMRGEQSVVTKDKDGFKVNGQKISSLSGSTLDVLALAIRVALTKTFIPHASFMTLDEPAHGCDQERTGNVLGFLAGVGFDQVLLASHDDLSEAVADHVIALGA